MTLSVALIAIHFLLLGFTTTILKILVTNATPLTAFAARNIPAGLLYIIVGAIFSKRRTNLLKYIPLHVVMGAFFRGFIPSSLSYWALQYVGAAKLAFFYNFCPFITYLFSYLILDEKITRQKLLGIAVAFCGVIPVLMANTSAEERNLTQLFSISLPEFSIMCAITSLCLGAVLFEKIVNSQKYSIFALTGHDAFFGGVLGLVALSILPLEQGFYHPVEFVKWAAIMTVVSGFAVRPLYAWLLVRYKTTLLSIASLSAPFTTALYSWLYFGDTIGFEFFYSTILVLLGCLIFYTDRSDREKPIPYEIT